MEKLLTINLTHAILWSTIVSIGLLGASGCQRRENVCHDFDSFLNRDPVTLAKRAVARGDRRPLALMGYGPIVVGRDSGVRPVIIIKGTGENRKMSCKYEQNKVLHFAETYNNIVAQK
jgi:hypothetical protein